MPLSIFYNGLLRLPLSIAMISKLFIRSTEFDENLSQLNTGRITKIVSKKKIDSFGQIR